MNRRFFKSKRNRVFSGICGGLAEYFKMDPSLVRVAWILISFLLGEGIGGLIIYIIAAIIIPERPEDFSDSFDQSADNCYGACYNDDSCKWNGHSYLDDGKGKVIIGAGLIIVGLLAMLRQMFHIRLDVLLPVLLIGIGAFIIYRGRGGRYE